MASRALLNGWPLVAGSKSTAPVLPLSITGTPASGTVGSGDTFTPTVTGGTAPYTLSLASGTLPPGRTVNGSAGTVTGSYTTAGSYSYVLRVTDAVGATADLNVSVTVGAGGTLPAFAYQTESATLFSSMATQPPERRKYTYDMAIRRLKEEGLFSELLGLWTAGSDPVDSRRNLITPGTYDLVPVGSPTFTANDGWIASSVTADTLDTQIPLGALNINSACMGYTCPNMAEVTSDNTDMGTVSSTGGIIIRSKTSSESRPKGRVFCADNLLSPANVTTSSYGFFAVTRTNSSTLTSHHSGVNNPEVSAASFAPGNAALTISLLKATGAGSGSGRKFRTAFVAKRGLTELELRKLHAIILEMETAIAYGEPLIREAGYAPATVSADVVVYGWTGMAVTAAYSAKRAGKSVVVVGGWRDTNFGGMSGNGLGFVDFDRVAALWGLPSYIINRLKTLRGITNGTSTIFEPRSFEWVCREMMDPTRANGLDIPVYASTGVASATKSGAKLTSITTNDGRTFTGAQFVDCSYETDLAPFAGVSFLVGREAAGSGMEAFNGFRGVDLSTQAGSLRNPVDNSPISIDPYIVPGDAASGLIKTVSPRPATATGGADSLNQAFNFRLTWTNSPTRRIPFDTAPPPNYDKANYEVLLRQFAILPDMTFAQVFKADAVIPSGVFDTNNQTYGFSTDSIDGAADYVTATTNAGREAAWKKVENYILGLIYCLLYENDSRIPSAVRSTLATYGWDAYNYVGKGKAGDRLFFPRALYVREFRRIRSDIIWNGNDIAATDGTTPRSIKTVANASYAMDSHNTLRFADTSVSPARVVNEGGLFQPSAGGSDKISPLPIDIFIPKKAECENCSFIFGSSSTHVAFGSIRMELTAMETAQSMALAAVQAITAGQALQDLDYPTLRTAILNSATLTGETAPTLPQVN